MGTRQSQPCQCEPSTISNEVIAPEWYHSESRLLTNRESTNLTG